MWRNSADTHQSNHPLIKGVALKMSEQISFSQTKVRSTCQVLLVYFTYCYCYKDFCHFNVLDINGVEYSTFEYEYSKIGTLVLFEYSFTEIHCCN